MIAGGLIFAWTDGFGNRRYKTGPGPEIFGPADPAVSPLRRPALRATPGPRADAGDGGAGSEQENPFRAWGLPVQRFAEEHLVVDLDRCRDTVGGRGLPGGELLDPHQVLPDILERPLVRLG